MIKSCSVFHIEQKMEFEKFNCFFFIRLYTRQKLSDFYILRSFTERYFLTDYSYILENHFYFVNVSDYCFKPSLSRIFFLNCKNCKSIVSSIKRSFDPCISHIIALHVNCLQKERNRQVSQLIFSPNVFWAKGNPELYVFISSQIQESS